MKEVLFTIDFVLCLAVSILGILIVIDLRKKTSQPFLSSLLFYIVFLSAFGLYGIWGQQFLYHVLTPVENPALMETISRFISFLGVPFLVTAWFMLVKFTMDIRCRSIPLFWIIGFFLVNISCIILSWIFLTLFSADSLISDSSRVFFTGFTIAYFLIAGFILIFTRSTTHSYKGRFSVSFLGWLVIASGVLISVPPLFAGNYYLLDLGISLLFFLGMIVPVLYLRMSPSALEREQTAVGGMVSSSGYEAFCRQYEISPREAEIILELCQGRANREIADRLFITLQTVKDHLYRIFIKTDVKSRVQLVNLVRSFEPNWQAAASTAPATQTRPQKTA